MKKTRTKASKKTSRTTISIDDATHELGVRLAKGERRSFSGLIGQLIVERSKKQAA